MPGRMLSKIMRSSYCGQIFTAGVLVVAAAMLLLAVSGALGSGVKQPDDSNAMQPMPVALITEIPINQAAGSELGPAKPADESAVIQQVPDGVNGDVDKMAIGALWSGALLRDYGWQFHPLYKDWRYQSGVIISGASGQIVPALMSGQVVDVFTDNHYGLTVAVKSENFTIYYGSLSSVAVYSDNLIQQGRTIGVMGSGAGEPGPHLYLAVKTGENKYLDPKELFLEIKR
ncbi:MAG: peptidoglycan DD-metalloendopeptidase family protein [Sporomusa sp.]